MHFALGPRGFLAEKIRSEEMAESAPVAGASESTTKAGGGVEGGRTPAATPAGGGSGKKKKSGKEKRREKRLRNEPRSVSGKVRGTVFCPCSSSDLMHVS